MNQKIKNYSVLALSTVAIIPTACKKDKSDDIVDAVINKTLQHTGGDPYFKIQDSLDIDGDGTFDFNVATLKQSTFTSLYYPYNKAYIEGKQDENEVLVSGKIVTEKDPTNEIGSESITWKKKGFIGYFYSASLEPSVGHAGDGDKFIGFRFKKGTDTHYGWAKINLSEDFKTLIIKETAYHKIPNTPITVGAKKIILLFNIKIPSIIFLLGIFYLQTIYGE